MSDELAEVVGRFDVSMSRTIGKIAAALAKAQAVMGPAIKDKEGVIPGKDGRTGYRYGYATLAACFEALQPVYDNGIAITQIPLDGGNGVRIATYLLHESGEWIRGELWMPVGQQTPQGVGSAMTYARRYGLQALTGLASDDDDGSLATHGVQPAQAQPIPQPKPTVAKAGPKLKPTPTQAAPRETGVSKMLTDAGYPLPAPVPGNGPMWDAIADVVSFEALHKLVMETQAVPEADRAELFEALAARATLLFAEAPDLATVQKGFPVVTQLGQPADLREAANAAYTRFRNGAQS